MPLIDVRQVKNLVLQGGSVRDIAYLGALSQFEAEGGKLTQIQRVAGTSAGAISATLLAIGYRVEWITDTLNKLDFKELLDEAKYTTQETLFAATKQVNQPTNVFSKLFSISTDIASNCGKAPVVTEKFSNTFGIFEGERLRTWLVKKIYIQTGDADLTFADLHKLHQEKPYKYKDLCVVGTNLSTGYAEAFNYQNTPDVIIADAVRISMSIPFLFKPHMVHLKIDGERRVDPNKHFYIDGGLIDNYPIDVFDYAGYVDSNLTGEAARKAQYNIETLGFRLVSKTDWDYFLGQEEVETLSIIGFLPHFKSLLQAINNKQTSDYYQRNDKQRTVYIDTQGVDMLSFDLTDTDKEKLIFSSKTAVKEYFARQRADHQLSLPCLSANSFFQAQPASEEQGMIKTSFATLQEISLFIEQLKNLAIGENEMAEQAYTFLLTPAQHQIWQEQSNLTL